jgi:hypothetical protein
MVKDAKMEDTNQARAKQTKNRMNVCKTTHNMVDGRESKL